MAWSEKRCINFLNKVAEMKEAIKKLTDDDVEILKLVSDSLTLNKRFEMLKRKEQE